MNLLAIDPGSTDSAFVLYDLKAGKILQAAKVSNDDMLTLLEANEFQHLAIEMIACYGMPVGADVFETCVWIGRFIERAGCVPTTRIKRMECKMHLCHNPRAKDGNIRQALIDRFGAPGTKKNPGALYGVSGDVWAALAVAVTLTDRMK